MGRFASNISRNQAYEKMKKCKFEIIDGKCVIREETKIPLTVRMLGHDVASVYVPEEIDDEDHLEEVKREEECDVEPCDGGDELPF